MRGRRDVAASLAALLGVPPSNDVVSAFSMERRGEVGLAGFVVVLHSLITAVTAALSRCLTLSQLLAFGFHPDTAVPEDSQQQYMPSGRCHDFGEPHPNWWRLRQRQET